MAFTYNPKDASTALPADKYPASIAKCHEGVSKSSQNPMLTVSFTVYTATGGERTVKDYIVNPSTLWKLRRLAKALGKSAEFDAGTFAVEKHIGANLTLELDIQQQEGFDESNTIVGYEPKTGGADRRPTTAARDNGSVHIEPVTEEDIPF